jgi:hypothetical protein
MNTENLKFDNTYTFSTIEEAIYKLKLDRRIEWFEFQGKVVKKAKGDKLGHKFPEPLLINNSFVYIKK